MSGQELSQFPTDQLIRDLIATGRPATPRDIREIIERIATAPFDSRQKLPLREREASQSEPRLDAPADSLTYHLLKRITTEQQWAPGTTSRQYLEDLRQGVRAPGARLVLYRQRGGALASVIATTGEAVPSARQGPLAQPNLLVVYSADRGIIITGYQFSALDRIRIPQEALWLK